MPWPELGIWSGKTAAELRPVIVALCNAVGDRYECIGMDRPYWPVNLDQSEDTFTAGFKSAALLEEDLYRLDLFRYGWWQMIASAISVIVGLGAATPGGTGLTFRVGTTFCGGWSKSGTGAGHGSDLWTLAELEADVGLGTLSQSVIGGPMHLFDEIAPQRFRQMLDRLIYPVIFPKQRNDYFVLASEGWTTADTLAENERLARRGIADETPNSQKGDDIWPALTKVPDAVSSQNLMAGFLLQPTDTYLTLYGFKQTLSHCVLEFDSCENGVGCLGEIIKQYIGIKSQYLASLDGVDVEILGQTTTIPGEEPIPSPSYEFVTLSETDIIPDVTGKQYFTISLSNFANSPDSPFTFDPDFLEYEDYGYCYVNVETVFASGIGGPGVMNMTRSQCTRFILDITAHCSDQ